MAVSCVVVNIYQRSYLKNVLLNPRRPQMKMTLPKENHRLTRFIHEHIHETTKDLLRNLVANIINKWEDFKEKELEKGKNEHN